MNKEKVKELIETYISDGFHFIDICLKDGNVIMLNNENVATFDEENINILGKGYSFKVNYSEIKGIDI